MKKWLQKRLKNEKGLTLVELLAVIVILGIIAAIAVPSIGGIIQSSREKAAIADATNALAAADLYFIGNDTEEGGTVTLTNGTKPALDFGLAPEYFEKDSTLESVTVTKLSDGNKIVFKTKDVGGKVANVTTGLTKRELNKENVKFVKNP